MMGLMRAKEYIFTGARIPASTALELGLVNKVVPAGEALSSALGLAHTLAELPARALRDTKRVMNLHATRALVGMLDQALACERVSVNSLEHAERTTQLVEASRARAATRSG
jgi:enoyl-CoA hydratase